MIPEGADPRRPWTWRDPVVRGDAPRTAGDFLADIEVLASEAPGPWMERASAFAREWLVSIGIDPDRPAEVRAYLLGCSLVNPNLDLCLGLWERCRAGG